VVEEIFTLERVFTDQLECPQTVEPLPPPSGLKLLVDPKIVWAPVNGYAIHNSNDPNADVWNAGHVNDIVPWSGGLHNIPGGLIVASDTSGLWLVSDNPISGLSQALPLSHDLTAVDMTSLALGPDGSRHVYAATWGTSESPGGYLYETDPSSSFNPKPPCNVIQKVVVAMAPRRLIVLACDNGIWWSAIPPAPSVKGAYQWKQAVAVPPLLPGFLQGQFSGLAPGPDNGNGQPTVIAAAWGGSTPSTQIYRGSWSNGNLAFQSASVENPPGQVSGGFGRTSLTSCPQDLTQMCAVAADSNDINMAAIWSSADGGQNWSMATLPPNPGQQGNYNNVIAVAGDCHAVAVGWQAGTFISYDGASSWNPLKNADGHLHGDVHALTFDPDDPTTLYIGSDGGMAAAYILVQGRSPTFVSKYNRLLYNLQAYHAAAASTPPGVISEATQDNGVLWSAVPPTATPGPLPWQHLTDCGCDGWATAFIDPPNLASSDAIILESEFGLPFYPWQWAQANGNSSPIFGFNSQQGIPIGKSQNALADGPPLAPAAVVRTPTYANAAGQKMYSLTALGPAIYGSFANDDGGLIHWEQLGSAGASESVSALSSSDGTDVLAGTNKGNLYRLGSPYTAGGSASKLVINLPDSQPNQNISAALEISSTIAFASMTTAPVSAGYVLQWVDQSKTWQALGGGLPSSLPFTSLEAADLGTVFAATKGTVYVTRDFGSTWSTASAGLPVVSDGTDLHYVVQSDGAYLYLGTFGWSLWRARLH
jgi:hypothetical protein